MKIDIRRTFAAADWSAVDARHDLPDLDTLRRLAVARVDAKARIVDRKLPKGRRPSPEEAAKRRADEIERRFMGLIGERQVARLLGLPMQLDVSIRGDGRANLTTAHGVPVDVITRTPQGPLGERCPDLLLNTRETARPELALVLVTYFGPAVDPWVVGWAWEVQVRQASRLVDLSANRSYLYPPASLRPLITLACAAPWKPAPVQTALFSA